MRKAKETSVEQVSKANYLIGKMKERLLSCRSNKRSPQKTALLFKENH